MTGTANITAVSTSLLTLAGLLVSACDQKAVPSDRVVTKTADRTPANEAPVSYFLAAMVRFDGGSPCPFKVNAVRPWCVRLAQPPFAGPGRGKRRFEVLRPIEDCTAGITGIRCDEPHLFFDPATLDTIWGSRRFAAGGAFLIDRIASGKDDWLYRLYDGDGYNMTVTCFYPARANKLSARTGQLSNSEVRRLCEIDRLPYDDS